MLLNNNMEKEAGSNQKGDDYRFFGIRAPTLGLYIATGFALIAVLFSLGGGIFGNELTAGPSFAVETGQGAGAATVTVSPTTLDDTALRIGWSVGTAMVYLALALLLFTGAQIYQRTKDEPLFSDKVQALTAPAWGGVLLLYVIGSVTRWLLEGRIGDALQIDRIDANDAFFFEFIFDIPFLLLWFIGLAVQWAWVRGRTLQDDLEDIV